MPELAAGHVATVRDGGTSYGRQKNNIIISLFFLTTHHKNKTTQSKELMCKAPKMLQHSLDFIDANK